MKAVSILEYNEGKIKCLRTSSRSRNFQFVAKFKRQDKNWRLNFQIKFSDKQKKYVAQKQYIGSLFLRFDCDHFLFPYLFFLASFAFYMRAQDISISIQRISVGLALVAQ